MLRTITLGSYISIQGFQVGQAVDGKITVRVDKNISRAFRLSRLGNPKI